MNAAGSCLTGKLMHMKLNHFVPIYHLPIPISVIHWERLLGRISTEKINFSAFIGYYELFQVTESII